MGGDHGHGSKLILPDYKMWKWEGTPLEVVQKKLARQGLKDPWARNEAWKFMGRYGEHVPFSSLFLRGFKWGFGAFLVSLAVENMFFPPKPKH